MDNKLTITKEITTQVDSSVGHIRESVDKMDTMMSSFLEVVDKQNSRMNKLVSEQNKKIDSTVVEQDSKIDEFINSDKRMSHRKELFVSIIQVFSGIIIAVLTMWMAGG